MGYNEMTWWELDDREMQRVGKVTLTGAPFSVGADVAIKDEGSWHEGRITAWEAANHNYTVEVNSQTLRRRYYVSEEGYNIELVKPLAYLDQLRDVRETYEALSG